MARIAVGGFQHETNTFAPSKASFEEFAAGSGWPALTRGDPLFPAVAGINLPISGFVDEARSLGHQLVPLAWAAASPSAQVTEEAFERITGQIFEELERAGGVDAVYLDLHGAMVTEHFQDGEGEILRRLRARVGTELPVVTSLDLHANVTPEMVALSESLVAYRTYPHVDMAETGARAARQLTAILRSGRKPAKAFRQIPFLLPITQGCTLYDPAKGIYETLAELEAVDDRLLSFCCGFAPADIHHAGPSLVAYGAEAEAAAERLDGFVRDREADFLPEVWKPQEAVSHAIARARQAGRPMVLADTQDNPGAGGESDTVFLLEELVRQRAEGASMAILFDPASAKIAHEAGQGSEITLGIGAHSGQAGHSPFQATFKVERLGDGRFTGTGPFYKGARMRLGPMALLSLGGVRVVLGSRKVQAADQSMFRHLGVEPTAEKILVLKSSVHFRADFQPIAEEVLVVAAPGPNPVDHAEFDYRNLRPEIRRMPRSAQTGL